jgi:hypothetical protein
MKIHKRSKQRIMYYYNIKPKDLAIVQQLHDENELNEAMKENEPQFNMDNILRGVNKNVV